MIRSVEQENSVCTLFDLHLVSLNIQFYIYEIDSKYHQKRCVKEACRRRPSNANPRVAFGYLGLLILWPMRVKYVGSVRESVSMCINCRVKKQ